MGREANGLAQRRLAGSFIADGGSFRVISFSNLTYLKSKLAYRTTSKSRGSSLRISTHSSALQNPSQHNWVTIEDGYLWWCTVRDGITVNLDKGKEKTEGSFWLSCNRPWSNRSIGGRLLARADLPGIVGAVAGFRAAICVPKGSPDILRIIQDRKNPDAVAATQAREAYTAAVVKLVAELHDRDFELLIDLILARTGWTRLAKLGGATEGIDIEAENAATNEIAFVQVKSEAGQGVLDDYVQRFQARRERYNRMIFAVHKPIETLKLPAGEPIQIWSGERIAQLAVQLGLGEWIANRL
jgi:hypothetical protein